MTSKQLIEKAKEIKKKEKTIALLERIRKDMMNLSRLNYASYQVISSKFNDDLYYDLEDKIKEIKEEIKQ